MCDDQTFSFAELNLDFLEATPLTQGAPQVIRCLTALKLEKNSEQQKPAANTTKTSQLAARIASTDALVQEIRKLKVERTELQQQLHGFNQSAIEIQNLYQSEKQQRLKLQSDMDELREECDKLDTKLTNEMLRHDQEQARCDENKGPLNFGDLAMRYLKLTQKLDEENVLPWQEQKTIEDLIKYCQANNFRVPVHKKHKKRIRNSKTDKSIQCEFDRKCDLLQPLPTLLCKGRSVRDQSTQSEAVETRSQSTQYISTTTTRSTSTSCFISTHSVGTCFPEPKPFPTLDDMIEELLKWDSIPPLSPISDVPTPVDMSLPTTARSNSTHTSIGTCTQLCNVQRQIDFVPNMPNIKRSTSRPPSRLMYDVKDEVTSPMSTESTSKMHGNQQWQSLTTLQPSIFEEMWHIFGQMLYGLLHYRNDSSAVLHSETISQQEFQNWMRSLYKNMQLQQQQPQPNSTPVYFGSSEPVLQCDGAVASKITHSPPQQGDLIGTAQQQKNEHSFMRINTISNKIPFAYSEGEYNVKRKLNIDKRVNQKKSKRRKMEIGKTRNNSGEKNVNATETAVDFLTKFNIVGNCDTSEKSQPKKCKTFDLDRLLPSIRNIAQIDTLEKPVKRNIAQLHENMPLFSKAHEQSVSAKQIINTSFQPFDFNEIKDERENSCGNGDKNGIKTCNVFLRDIPEYTELVINEEVIPTDDVHHDAVIGKRLNTYESIDASNENCKGMSDDAIFKLPDTPEKNASICSLVSTEFFNDIITETTQNIDSEVLDQQAPLCSPDNKFKYFLKDSSSENDCEKVERKRKREMKAQKTCKRSERLLSKQNRLKIENLASISSIEFGKYTQCKNEGKNYFDGSCLTEYRDSKNMCLSESLTINKEENNQFKDRKQKNDNAKSNVNLGYFKERNSNETAPKNTTNCDNICIRKIKIAEDRKYNQKQSFECFSLNSMSLHNTTNSTSENCMNAHINCNAFESPASPEPQVMSADLVSSPKQIPLKMSASNILKKHNSLLQHFIDFYYSEHHYKYLNEKHRKNCSAHCEKTIARIQGHLKKCLENQSTNPDIEAAHFVEMLSQTDQCDYIVTSVVRFIKTDHCYITSSFENTTEKCQNISLIHRLSFVFRRLQCIYPRFTNQLLVTTENILFNCNNFEKLSLQATLNLTQLYLLALANEPSHPQGHPARLFAAKCFYYKKLIAIPMLYEVLCWFPATLPHREDRRYTYGSDALITVIQHLLMCTKYDMEKADLRTKELLSKLRFEYHFEPYKPDRQEVFQNLLEKLESNKLAHLEYAFALFCKRLNPAVVATDVLQAKLIPMANEYYLKILKSANFDEHVVVLLNCISMVVKPFPLDTDVSVYISLFTQFLNAVDRPAVQEAAVQSILRLQRFGVANCFCALSSFKPTYDLQTSTKAMIKTFIHRRSIKFWKTLEQKAFKVVS